VITHNSVIGEMADRVLHFADGQVADYQVNSRRQQARELSW
jgi:putative ABC transport system ATP-binding protein